MKREKNDISRTKMISWTRRIDPELNHLWRGGWGNGRLEPARYLYDHELVLVQRGSCRVAVGAQSLELEAGSWIIIPPATITPPWLARRASFAPAFTSIGLPGKSLAPPRSGSFIPAARPRGRSRPRLPSFLPA